MDSIKQLLISCASFPEPQIPEAQIRSTIKYIMRARDYKRRVQRANLSGFTFLPPYDQRWQPRPMNTLDRFLSAGWKKGSWEAYSLKENAKDGPADQHRVGPKISLKRGMTVAFFGALVADIGLSLIIWLLLMMAISFFGLEIKWGVQIDSFELLIGIFGILFILLFLGFLVFIRPKKTPS